MVLGLCRLLLRDPVEAEDATQQVFLSAQRAVARGSPPREPHAWLAEIARNECRLRMRERMREPLALPDLPTDLPDPLAAAIRRTDLEAIWAAISSLPRRQRRALVLREVGGLSYRELGRALGVSQSSVESLLFRARRQVRALVLAATPLALRNDLGRLIPDFDAGSAGLAARVGSLPVAVKLATAAVTVGLVGTGATQFPQHHSRPEVRMQPKDSPAFVDRIEHPATGLVTARRLSGLRTQAAPKHEQDSSDRSGEQRPEHAQQAEPPDEEHLQPRREPADVEATQAEPGQDTGTDGSSGDRTGSSGGSSQADGSAD